MPWVGAIHDEGAGTARDAESPAGVAALATAFTAAEVAEWAEFTDECRERERQARQRGLSVRWLTHCLETRTLISFAICCLLAGIAGVIHYA